MYFKCNKVNIIRIELAIHCTLYIHLIHVHKLISDFTCKFLNCELATILSKQV